LAERKPTFSWLLHKPLCFLGFGFGSGLSPVAPGTAGTLAALPLAFVLCLLGIDGWILLLLCIGGKRERQGKEEETTIKIILNINESAK